MWKPPQIAPRLRLTATAAPTSTPSKLTITGSARLDLEAKGKDGESKRPTFEILGYTGALMNVAGFYHPVIVDLSGLTAERQQIPVLLDHESDQIVGQTDSIRIDADGVHLSGVVTGDDAVSSKVITHAKNGFNWQASIGATIDRDGQEFIKAGEAATVNGLAVKGPAIVARRSRLFEVSFTAIGADGNTSADVAASLGPLMGASPMQFEAWLRAKGIDPAAPLDDNTKNALRAMYDNEMRAGGQQSSAPPPAGNNPAASLPATPSANPQLPAVYVGGPDPENDPTVELGQMIGKFKGDHERKRRINVLASEAAAERPWFSEEFETLAAKAHEAGTSVDKFEVLLLQFRAHVNSGGMVRRTGEIGDKIVEAAVCRSGGLKDAEKHYSPETLEAADKHFGHGIGLKELILAAAKVNGYHGHSTAITPEVFRAAFGGGGRDVIRANDGFSTLSLPGILSNVANKFLLQAFMAVESTWREISRIKSVRDFKTNTSYSLTGGMTYDLVPPSGEIKHGQLGELSYTNKIDTYGRMFSISRPDIVNDDLGALTDIPQRLGRGAALKLNLLFWTKFLSGVGTFWTSPLGNLATGGDSVLSSDGLSDAEQLFLLQTDPDGNPLGIEPRILLVPSALKNTATELMSSQFVNTGGSSTTDRVPNENVWRNRFRVVSSTYLSNPNITNYSTTAWWLLADPADLPTIEVAFLNGRETPVVEQADADFNVLGIQFRGYHDVGVALMEYRASTRNAGS